MPTVSPPHDPSAKRVFELFVETLVVERDEADYALLLRVEWFGEEVIQVAKRLKDSPRSALSLVDVLAFSCKQLEHDAAAAATMEDNVHQARRWARILPETDVADETFSEVEVEKKRDGSTDPVRDDG